MAESIFQRKVDEAGLSNEIMVDSAGTSSYHVGERAASETRRVLAAHGMSNNGRSRQVHAADFADESTYVIALDAANMRDIRYRFGDQPRLALLMSYAENSDVMDVPDPYYERNFETVYELIEDGCQGLLAAVREAEGL